MNLLPFFPQLSIISLFFLQLLGQNYSHSLLPLNKGNNKYVHLTESETTSDLQVIQAANEEP